MKHRLAQPFAAVVLALALLAPWHALARPELPGAQPGSAIAAVSQDAGATVAVVARVAPTPLAPAPTRLPLHGQSHAATNAWLSRLGQATPKPARVLPLDRRRSFRIVVARLRLPRAEDDDPAA